MEKHDAIALLKADHAAVKKLFGQEEKLTEHDGHKKQEIFDQIKAALEVHATIEEEIFYPAVKKARSENVKDEVREGYEEHKQIKEPARRDLGGHAGRRNLGHEDQSPQRGR